ncbi:MAG: MOSC domain-containing protein [Phycisphaerales bacterium]|nr:MOSC domain-containing protein [Phycisphaerales bacterium]
MIRLVALHVGRPHVLLKRGRRYSTSFGRRPVEGRLQVTADGIDGDRVADNENHGGPDKAVCVYSREHYSWLAELLGRGGDADSVGPAAAGENFTTLGLLESQVCIGDVLSVGEAVLQVAQPRMPCFKFANRHDEPRLVDWIYETGHCGFYLRVLTAGSVGAGDEIRITRLGESGLTVSAVLMARGAGGASRSLLQRIADAAEITEWWRGWARERIASGAARDD